MIYSVVAYYDLDLEKFNPPMIAPMSEEQAEESIVDGVRKGKVEGAESFQAFYFGSFDTATGKFNLLEKPKLLVDLTKYVRKDS